MVLVSQDLVYYHLRSSKLRTIFELLESDREVQALLKMSNVMAVNRLNYNDHGPVHSRIVSGAALEIFNNSLDTIIPSIVKDKIGDVDDARIVVFCGAYLHDIGNAVHRENHYIHGVLLANSILSRLLPKIYGDDLERGIRIKSEILHSIYAHQEGVSCLSTEAGIAKIADGTDMAQGRARVPYRIGKVDIHSLSALSIKSIEILKGEKQPIQIIVNMENPSGVFQIEGVLQEKIETSGIEDKVEVVAYINDKELKRLRFDKATIV